MKLKKIKNIKVIVCTFLCLLFAYILIKYPSVCAEGVKEGLELCLQTMIPSLFPFLVLASFASSSGVIDFFGKKSDAFFKKFFGLSGAAGSCVIFSLFGGFPVGCSMASSLYGQNRINSSEAKRIALGCVNAGPAFVIGAVGTMMLSSRKAGIIIFASLSLSSLAIAFLTRFFVSSDNASSLPEANNFSVAQAVVSSVYNASKSMFSVCGWILLFSCFLGFLSSIVQNEKLLIVLKSVLEVSLGCNEAVKEKNPAIITAILGWSGLCVHCQVFAYITKIGLKIKYFFCARFFQALLSSFICGILLKLFPCEISVFSSGTSAVAKSFAVSLPAALGLLLMCVILILDLDSYKKMC